MADAVNGFRRHKRLVLALRATGLIALGLALPKTIAGITAVASSSSLWWALSRGQYSVSDRFLVAVQGAEWQTTADWMIRYGIGFVGTAVGLYLFLRARERLLPVPRERIPR